MRWFNKQDGFQSLRLHKLAQTPTMDDLLFLLSKAQRNWRAAVELSWQTPDLPNPLTIVVQCVMGTGDPVWTLLRGEGPQAATIWAYTSPDVTLIHNLVCLESTPKQKEEKEVEAQSIGSGRGRAGSGSGQFHPPSEMSSVAPGPGGGFEAAYAQSQTSPELGLHAGGPAKFDPVEIDQGAIDSVLQILSRSETGILTQSAFMFFLQQEYYRFRRGGLPFAVVMFEMGLRGETSEQGLGPLPNEAVREVVTRIESTRRELDLLAHYGFFDYVFLLPHTDTDGAAIFAKRVEALIVSSPLTTQLTPDSVDMYFGVASMPEDCQRPGALLSAAIEAKTLARARGLPMVLFRELEIR